MNYQNTKRGIFRARPNRFIAHVEIDGRVEICHVKNTGRCKELLTEGATVIVARSDNPQRKTAYDLIAVYKGNKLINMDSQAPNRVFGEWVRTGGMGDGWTVIKPECTYGSSRFDFYLEGEGRRAFVEVKGVTLETDGVVRFPDAPTERGVKHLHELIQAGKNGYEAYLFFVIQMRSCRYFTPNEETHPAFAEALRTAAKSGVTVRAVSCNVTEQALWIDDFVDVVL